MQLVNIYCGLDTNGANVDAHKLAHDLAALYFPHGHTVVNANGRWPGEVGIIDEPTLIVQVMFSDADSASGSAHESVNSFAKHYKFDANQESVLVTWQQIQAAFV